MKARIDQIAAWGYYWVEFDNMDWTIDEEYVATYDFQASPAEGAAYCQELCGYVHAYGMKCMAENTVEYADIFDAATFES